METHFSVEKDSLEYYWASKPCFGILFPVLSKKMWSQTVTINITLLCWLAVYLPTTSTCHLLHHCLLIKLWGIRVTEVISVGPVLLVNLVKMLNKLVCQNLIAHVNTYGCHSLQLFLLAAVQLLLPNKQWWKKPAKNSPEGEALFVL